MTMCLYRANAAIEGLDLAPMSVADVLTPEILRIVIDVQHEQQCKRAVERGEAVIPSKKSGTLKNTVAHFKAMATDLRSEEHTSELQSLMRISYAVFCLKKKNQTLNT